MIYHQCKFILTKIRALGEDDVDTLYLLLLGCILSAKSKIAF